ncbi:hypothetical protein [Actinomadura rudentiformis]|uniref:Uncharacterized protein n=1 Tax=Actinomadura rudentiformis TaxID=359158 RepID=A0A6H9Y6N5_9ACTN|nr:hypothetical protein [Actinomadura rudentiformis]KAB2339313.1 hypothetical protein F8566_48285 [Actinomadura rudentiformis]
MTQFRDFPGELKDEDGQPFRAAGARAVAVGVDERELVTGCAAVAGGFLHAGVLFDGVQGGIEAAGAFEQAHTLADQIVGPLPAFAVAPLARTVRENLADTGTSAW